MAGVTPRRSPAELAAALGELEVRVASARVERSAVPLPDYPDGPRPSSIVRLTGGECVGLGENVAFFEAEHERFAAYVEAWLRSNEGRPRLKIVTALGPEGTAYERAALEAALLDLGLRQAGLSLHDLTGMQKSSLRFVVSLAASPEPQAPIRRVRAAGYTGDLKIDVDPSWDLATLEALAQDSSIAIFDFKGRGDVNLAQKLALLSRTALFEDPPSDFHDRNDDDTDARPVRISRDANLKSARDVADARARGEAVNLKAPRMGGPLELLRGLEHAVTRATDGSAPRAPVYLGGMFEVGVGRAQARQLAALYCNSAPNDLAPNLASSDVGPVLRNPPTQIRLDLPGFGTS